MCTSLRLRKTHCRGLCRLYKIISHYRCLLYFIPNLYQVQNFSLPEALCFWTSGFRLVIKLKVLRGFRLFSYQFLLVFPIHRKDIIKLHKKIAIYSYFIILLLFLFFYLFRVCLVIIGTSLLFLFSVLLILLVLRFS